MSVEDGAVHPRQVLGHGRDVDPCAHLVHPQDHRSQTDPAQRQTADQDGGDHRAQPMSSALRVPVAPAARDVTGRILIERSIHGFTSSMRRLPESTKTTGGATSQAHTVLHVCQNARGSPTR